MSGGIALFALYAFVKWTGTNLLSLNYYVVFMAGKQQRAKEVDS
jgi:hypothetical protein